MGNRLRNLDVPAQCPGCGLYPGLCLCAELRPVATRTRILIVRHVKEVRRRTNSARIAALGLANCELLDRREKFDRIEFEPPPDSWVLYPGAPPPSPDAPRPANLIVLDGTWREAKRMFARVPALQFLPRLSLPPPPPTPRLRKPPAFGMATLEAIAHAVAALEGEELARPLHELFALFVARCREGARRVRCERNVGDRSR